MGMNVHNILLEIVTPKKRVLCSSIVGAGIKNEGSATLAVRHSQPSPQSVNSRRVSYN